MREVGSEEVRATMDRADHWVVSQLAWAETARAIGLRYGRDSPQMRSFVAEWTSMQVVRLDQVLAEAAAGLAIDEGLRSLDAIHLASGLAVAHPGLLFATWDARLHAAASKRGLEVLPERL